MNNSATDWLVATAIAADPFAVAIPDSSIFDLPTVAPGATASLAYDPIANTGLFGLTWDAGAPLGFVDSGIFTLSAQWWTGDPLAGGSFIEDAPDATANYVATVSGPTGPAAVPEPSSLILLITWASLSLGRVGGAVRRGGLLRRLGGASKG